MKVSQPLGTIVYNVKSCDTIANIALRFNTTPTELSRLNHLASSLLYPGQTLFVPDKSSTPNVLQNDSFKQAHISKPISHEPSNSIDIFNSPKKNTLNKTLSPDHSLERLLDNDNLHQTPDEVSKRYLKIAAKYVTDGQGVVAGTLLVTPQTLMFNPDVSDHLVMDRGHDTYIVRAPIKSIHSVLFYDDIAAMVVGDSEKQYSPTSTFIDYEQSLSPKPGVVVCQKTGEKFTLFSPAHSSEENQINNMIVEKQLKTSNESCDITDQGISTMSESQPSETTLKDENVVLDDGFNYKNNTSTTEPEKVSLFMQETKLSSTPKHSNNGNQTEHHTIDSCELSQSSMNIDVCKTDVPVENETVKESECMLDTDNKTFGNTSSSDKYSIDSNENEAHGDEVIQHEKEALHRSSLSSRFCDLSKDSGISEHSSSTHHESYEKSEDTLSHRSSLSNEARQWLGKRGIRLASMEESDYHSDSIVHSSTADDISNDVTPRPAKKIVDPLMYTAIKIRKSFWLPPPNKHNAIMGIPPNRDQKRRQHWFAIPKTRVDQLNKFLLHWAPDVNSAGSRQSTPISEEHVIEKSGDEGINFNDDTFEISPATNYGYEKVNGDDANSLSICGSFQTGSSQSSLRSLCDEEPDLLAESALLTTKQLGQLSRKLPSRTVGHSWELVYSTFLHGISLTTLYRNFADYDNPSLIIAKDEHGRVFGSFMSEPPKLSDSFYGTGESLLFTFTKENKVKVYQWSGENSFFIKGSKTSLSIGGGEGVFGLWFDEDLCRGRSHSCRTYDNETLSENEDFICTGLEAWAFV